MRLSLLAVGSRGDVQPYVALGLGLRAAGHEVTVATHFDHRELVLDQGLRFAGIASWPATPATQAWIESGRNPLAFATRLRPVVEDLFHRTVDAIVRACSDADAVLYSTLGIVGYHVAEQRGATPIAAHVLPFTSTAEFQSPAVDPGWPLPGFGNRLTHLYAAQAFWQAFRPHLNRWRVAELGLNRVPLLQARRGMKTEPGLTLYGYSPVVLPRPRDWGPSIAVTGYWRLGDDPEWRPSPALEAFLAEGPPPLYIGFGSMYPSQSSRLQDAVLGAVRTSGRRAVLEGGWAQGRASGQDHLFIESQAPHSWLFPRVATVVHHGGVGTTASGLRAGRPTVTVPFFADQFFWGRQVKRLGAGPAPISLKELTSERLAGAIGLAEAPGPRRRAAALGDRLRGEDGVARAVEAVERHLANRREHAAT